MPRSVWALQVAEATDIWARTGDVLAPESAPVISRAEGWAADFGVDGGRKPSRQRFNWLERVAFENLRDVVRYGAALPYRNDLDFDMDAVVTHSGTLYMALAANGPATTVVAPGTDDTVWAEVGADAGLTAPVQISQGGTGATTAMGALSGLGAAAVGHMHSAYAEVGHTHPARNLDELGGTLSLNKGGTGATTADGARTALDAAATGHTHTGFAQANQVFSAAKIGDINHTGTWDQFYTTLNALIPAFVSGANNEYFCIGIYVSTTGFRDSPGTEEVKQVRRSDSTNFVMTMINGSDPSRYFLANVGPAGVVSVSNRSLTGAAAENNTIVRTLASGLFRFSVFNKA